jgi:hypothetical protein
MPPPIFTSTRAKAISPFASATTYHHVPRNHHQHQHHHPNRRVIILKSIHCFVFIMLLVIAANFHLISLVHHVKKKHTSGKNKAGHHHHYHSSQHQQQHQQPDDYNNNNNNSRQDTTTTTTSQKSIPIETTRDQQQHNFNDAKNDQEYDDDDDDDDDDEDEDEDDNNLALCLLTKEDNDILPEWIAYHYHAVRLRHLIVAVDPSSRESPTSILNRFRNMTNKNSNSNSNSSPLYIEEWKDDDYLPKYFTHDQNYSHVPNFMGRQIQYMTFGDWCHTENVRPLIVKDMTIINNHRFRQLQFVTHCINHLWTIRQEQQQERQQAQKIKKAQQQRKQQQETNKEEENGNDDQDVSKSSSLEEEAEEEDEENNDHQRQRRRGQQQLRPPRIRFVSPLDSDEYIVINPRRLLPIRTTTTTSMGTDTTTTTTTTTPSPPPLVKAGAVLDFLLESMGERITSKDDDATQKDTTTTANNNNNNNNVQEEDDDHNVGDGNIGGGDRSCLPLPRLLFGSVPDNSTATTATTTTTGGSTTTTTRKMTLPFRKDRFETLRWKYHAPYQHEHNYIQKVLIDLSQIPPRPSLAVTTTTSNNNNNNNNNNNTTIQQEDKSVIVEWMANTVQDNQDPPNTYQRDFAYSVHQPSLVHCPAEVKDGLAHSEWGSTTPLSVNHYLGSWERYNTRNDKRRSERVSEMLCLRSLVVDVVCLCVVLGLLAAIRDTGRMNDARRLGFGGRLCL